MYLFGHHRAARFRMTLPATLGWTFCFLALAFSSALANYPLELVQTIQLPPNLSWDVQHWMDDSTYGWACFNNDTILYRSYLSDSTVAVEAPYHVSWLWSTPTRRVVIFRSSLYPATPTVAVMTRGADGYGMVEMDTLARVLLPSGLTFGPIVEFNAYHEVAGVTGYSMESQGDLYAWPPPPYNAQAFVSTRTGYSYYNGAGPNQEFWGAAGNIISSGNGGSLLEISPAAASSTVARFDSLLCLFSGGDAAHYDCDQIPEPPDCQTYSSSAHFFRARLQTYTHRVLCSNDTSLACTAPAVVAQRDANGTERVMLGNGECRNPVTWELHWTNPSATGRAGRMAGSQDERFLAYGVHVFNVFDAATGIFLGVTDTLIGSPRYLLKLPDRVCEIVTYVDSNRTVRIYRSAPLIPATPESLTVSMTDSGLVLRWSPVSTSDGGQPIEPPTYIVHTSEAPDGPFVASYATGSTSYVLALAESIRPQFYRVTAVADMAAARTLLLESYDRSKL